MLKQLDLRELFTSHPTGRGLFPQTNFSQTIKFKEYILISFFEDDDIYYIASKLLNDSNSDERLKRRGLQQGQAANMDHFKENEAARLHQNYIAAGFIYPRHVLQHRYRISRNVFLRIINFLRSKNPSFENQDTIQLEGLHLVSYKTKRQQGQCWPIDVLPTP